MEGSVGGKNERETTSPEREALDDHYCIVILSEFLQKADDLVVPFMS